MAIEVSVDDLTDLYKTGAVRLPQGAQMYAEAAQEVNKTDNHEGAGFSGGLGVSPVLASFQSMRDMFQNRILVKSRDNIVKAGGALCEIAVDFSRSDGQNAAAIDELKQDLENGYRIDDNGNRVDIPDYELPPDVDKAPEADSEGTPPTDSGADDKREEAPENPGDDLHNQ